MSMTETAYEPIGVHGQPPAHRASNRPAGYVDVRCIKCHAGLFVPPGTEAPRCDKCRPAPIRKFSDYSEPKPAEPAAFKYFRKVRDLRGSVSSPARDLVARMLYATRMPSGARDIELRSIAAEFDRTYRSAIRQRRQERARWSEHRRMLEEAEWDMRNDGERFDGGPL